MIEYIWAMIFFCFLVSGNSVFHLLKGDLLSVRMPRVHRINVRTTHVVFFWGGGGVRGGGGVYMAVDLNGGTPIYYRPG